jgi:surface polysaccharide O-acyltransferase-like enzyme
MGRRTRRGEGRAVSREPIETRGEAGRGDRPRGGEVASGRSTVFLDGMGVDATCASDLFSSAARRRRAIGSRTAPAREAKMPTERLRGLDDLRVLVVFLVVVLHAALTYMVYAPEWWYVVDPERSLLYTCVVLVVDVPIMLIMFFLAGYFCWPSFERRGIVGFVREKIVHIGIPWVFGVLVLAPPTAYVMYWSRHAPVSLFAFWTGDFWGVAYQQSVYWFLGILFALFLASVVLRLVPWLGRLPRRVAPPPGWLLPAFVGVMIVASLATGATLDFWSHDWVFSYQPARVPLYIGYFLLGIWADRSAWFGEGGWSPRLGRWWAAAFVSGALYLATRMLLPMLLPPWLFTGTSFVLFNLFCFTSVIAAVALFARWRSPAGVIGRSLSRSTYGVYYLHPLVLYPLAYAAVSWPISIHLKMPAITLISWLVCWALTALVLARVPGLKRIF